jgi:hypothetical protein
MRKQRKLRRLSINVPAFLKDYNDAVAAGMTVGEFCQVSGLAINTLHGRIKTLAKRGIVLPPLKGMRRRTKMGRLLGISPSPQPTPAKREVPAKDGIDYDALARAVLRRLTAAS